MSERPAWLAPSLALCLTWLVATALAIAAQRMTGGALPGPLAKVAPFLLAGLATARLVGAPARRPRLIACALLAIVAAAGWTGLTAVSPGLSPRDAATLFVAAIPVMLFGSVWAYAGLVVGAPQPATPAPGPQEVDALERELRDELARERGRQPSP